MLNLFILALSLTSSFASTGTNTKKAKIGGVHIFSPPALVLSDSSSLLHRIRGGGDESNIQDISTSDEDKVNDDNASSSSSSAVSKKMYNKQASNWVRTEPRCLSDFTGRPVVFGMLSEEIQRLNDACVLDVGCGEGYCARKVISMGASKVIGSDVSQEMIKSALATAQGDERFKFYSAPCSDLLNGLDDHCEYLGIGDRGAEESVDIAMAVFLFNYLTTAEMGDAINQIYTALKPGGVFVFSVPHPSMIYCHDSDAIFHLDSKGKGYFSSRDEKIFGQISTVDGAKLNIMSVHKTLNDYIKAINKAGFQILDIQEAGVTEEHLEMNREFFESVQDRPLHLIFKLQKPSE